MGGAGETFPNMIHTDETKLPKKYGLLSNLQSVMYMCTMGSATGGSSMLSLMTAFSKGAPTLGKEKTIANAKKSQWPSIRDEYSGQKVAKPSNWDKFWLNVQSWSNKHDRAQNIVPMQYGVTFNPDVGLCNLTKAYCAQKGVAFLPSVTVGNQNISDCNTTIGQDIGNLLFGPLQNITSAFIDNIADAKNRGLKISYLNPSNTRNNGDVFCEPGFSGGGTGSSAFNCIKCPPGTSYNSSTLNCSPDGGGCAKYGNGWYTNFSNCRWTSTPFNPGVVDQVGKSLIADYTGMDCGSDSVPINEFGDLFCVKKFIGGKFDSSLCDGIASKGTAYPINFVNSTKAEECVCGAPNARITEIIPGNISCAIGLSNNLTSLFSGPNSMGSRLCPPWKPCGSGDLCAAPPISEKCLLPHPRGTVAIGLFVSSTL